MTRFTVEETNLISIYHTGTRQAAIEEMTTALPYMENDMRELAHRTIGKLGELADADYSGLALDPADEQEE